MTERALEPCRDSQGRQLLWVRTDLVEPACSSVLTSMAGIHPYVDVRCKGVAAGHGKRQENSEGKRTTAEPLRL